MYIRVLASDIVLVRADGNYSHLLLSEGNEHVLTFQLQYMEEYCKKLWKNSFVRVGRSLIVNKDYIRVISLSDHRLVLGGNGMKKEISVNAPREALKDLKTLIENEKS